MVQDNPSSPKCADVGGGARSVAADPVRRGVQPHWDGRSHEEEGDGMTGPTPTGGGEIRLTDHSPI